jgi:hypothetical protein
MGDKLNVLRENETNSKICLNIKRKMTGSTHKYFKQIFTLFNAK